MVDDYLEESDDTVTIYFKPARSDDDEGYDAFFGEAMSSVDPDLITADETPVTPVSITGKMHYDIAGTTLSGDEGIDPITVGKFINSDAMFMCKTSDAMTGTSISSGLYFDNAHYVLDENNTRYSVDGRIFAGLGGTHRVQIFLRKTNV